MRGDAIASIIITAINIVGGLTIGVLRHGMPLSEAASTFTMLTVGDGLVSQIPALLVSTAAGIVVTKGGTDGTADVILARQLSGNAKPLGVAAALSALFALMPGLPAFPFLAIAVAAGTGAWLRSRAPAADSDGDVTEIAPQAAATPISDILKLDLLRLELGFGLLPLTGGDTPQLAEQIKRCAARLRPKWALSPRLCAFRTTSTCHRKNTSSSSRRSRSPRARSGPTSCWP